MASKEQQLLIKIAGEIDKSLGASIKGTEKQLSTLAKAGLKTKQMLGTGMMGGMSMMGKTLNGINKSIGVGITATSAALVGLGASAIRVGSEFESAMSQVQATMLLDRSTAEGQAAFETLSNAAKECGRTTNFSATEAAQGLNYLALAGYNAEKAATALPTILKLAGAGAMDLASASDMVTDAMSALQIEATQENLTMFSDQLAKTASIANTSVSQLGDALITVGGTANTLSGGLTEANTALAILADNGIKASEGGTALRNIINSLTSKSDDLAELGVAVKDAKGDMRSVEEIFYDLNLALGNMGKVDKQVTLGDIFNQVDLKSVQALMAATTLNVEGLSSKMSEMGLKYSDHSALINQIATDYNTLNDRTQATQWIMEDMGVSSEQANSIFDAIIENCGKATNRFQDLSAAIENSNGACEEMYKIQNDNLKGDFKTLGSAFEGLQISIFEGANNDLRAGVQLATELVGIMQTGFDSGGMTGMVESLGSCLTVITSQLATVAPTFVSTGMNVLNSFASGITANAPLIAASTAQVGAVFMRGMFDLIPQIYLTGIDLITEFSRSITGEIPRLMRDGQQALKQFANGIATSLPEMTSAGMTLLQTFSESLAWQAPMLMQSGLVIVGTLANSLIQSLPTLMSSGLTLLSGLAEGIISNIPMLLGIGQQLVANLAAGISTMLPNLVTSATQIFTTLITGLISNIPNIISTGVDMVVALGLGLLQAIPSLLSMTGQLASNIVDAILNTNWIDVGVTIVKSLAKGIVSLGKGLWDTIKSIFTGKEPPDLTSAGIESANSYVNGLRTASANASNIFPQVKVPPLDSTQLQSMNLPPIQADLEFDLSVQDATSKLNEIASQAGTTFNSSFNASVSNLPINIDTTQIVTQMNTAGTDAMTGLSNSINTNSPLVTTAIDSMGTNINTSLDTSFKTAENRALTSMQQISAVTLTEAQNAANAIKNAFENMIITIPKPKIPQINVSNTSVPYGEGGSVSIPNFDVSWHAQGGIFTQPTVLNTYAGPQGFGEAGQEAILPLDTLWGKMKNIMIDVINSNNQNTSILEDNNQNKPIVIKLDLPNQQMNQSIMPKVPNTLQVPSVSINNQATTPTLADNPNVINFAELTSKLANRTVDPATKAMNQLNNQMPENSGDNSWNVKYSPSYNFYSSEAPDKKEIQEATKMSQAEFNKMMDSYMKQKKRTAF